MVGSLVNRTAELGRLIADAQRQQSDDSRAMDQIIRRFEGLTQRLARSMTRSPELRDDLANAARVGLVRAVRRHNLCQPGFPAYAEKYMRGAVLREYQRWIVPDVPAADVVEEITPGAEVSRIEDQVIDRLAPWGDGPAAEAIAALAPEQRKIAASRYLDDAPLASIAAATGTTVSAVSQRLSTIHRAVEIAIAA